MLGYPGEDSGGKGKSQTGGKKWPRKVKNGEKSPWGQCLTRPVLNGGGLSPRMDFFCTVPRPHFLGRLLRRACSRSFCIISFEFVKVCGIRSSIWENFIHRRTGRGARGAAAPPNFGQLRFFGQHEKIWAKPVFKDVCMFLLLF